MKIDKPQVAGYGLHYHANNQLIQNAIDRVVFQSLIDEVRKQLATSLDNQTIMLSMSQLSRLTSVERAHSLPASINRLEQLGLLKKYKNGLLINCDEYVTLVQLYETLPQDKKIQLSKSFTKKGVSVLEDFDTCVNLHSRTELLSLSGSSIMLNNPYLCKSSQFTHCEPQNCEDIHTPSDDENCEYLHSLADYIAKMINYISVTHSFESFSKALTCEYLHNFVIDALKEAYMSGKFPKSFLGDLKNLCKSSHLTCEYLHNLALKTVKIFTTVIIYNNKDNKGSEAPYIGGENKTENINDGFENFGKVEILELNDHSEEINEGAEEIDELSQQNLKRAEKALRARNSYRNKPFIKVERMKEIVECLDEVIKFPVDFFLYQFWWGIFDLYCDHYHPSNKIDEEGEPIDNPQLIDWKEMIGAPLPQDEIYALAKNVYEDLVGAVEQGRYVYGNNNEWEIKFNFDSFEDFIPHEMFQWSPCTMQDKSVPALKVAIDRFYDIEAKKVFTPSKGDKKAKNAQNKKFIQLILSSEDSKLTPMEAAVKTFYRDFVVTGEDNVIDEFTDGKGSALESGGGLPDYLLKPWCIVCHLWAITSLRAF